MDGRFFADWHQADGRLGLCWREEARQLPTGDSAPKGFDTTLMLRLIEVEFGGKIDREVTPHGWTTRLSIPLSSVVLAST